jgi:uncharacterized protein YifN (PemK superfamily)
MALKFQPKAGTVFMCDFAGFVEPEMVKNRPVVVISKNRGNNRLVTVVPLSTTQPTVMEPYHYQLPVNPVPAYKSRTCWAKCDMISTVSLERLDRLKDGWTRVVPMVTLADLGAIRLCVVNALQLKNTILANQMPILQAENSVSCVTLEVMVDVHVDAPARVDQDCARNKNK